MHEKKTSNRNLEEGLRLLFHDLYLKGHIFEALFDLPAYLIQKSGIGFTPKEMEQHLNVKPSTIKKYIRIMTEAGMLESIKSEASKSIYRIHVENIMRRYGLEVSKSPKTSGSHA
jgi:DNA-binding MarR family transcriptional regulator